jgi:hypothetical protein
VPPDINLLHVTSDISKNCEHRTLPSFSMILFSTRNKISLPGMAAYTCNPSYLGSRDEKDHSLRPAYAKL